MVSLGFMAKGYRMREDQVRQEEAQKSAMDLKREQFEFRKSAHAETIASTKAQLKAKQETQEKKAAYEFVEKYTGPKANPYDPIQLNILAPNVQAKVLAMNAFRSVIEKNGKITYFPKKVFISGKTKKNGIGATVRPPSLKAPSSIPLFIVGV